MFFFEFIPQKRFPQWETNLDNKIDLDFFLLTISIGSSSVEKSTDGV